MIEVLLGAGILGLVVVVLSAWLALRLIRRRGRPEVQGHGRRAVFAVTIIGFATAAAWAPVMERTERTASKDLLSSFCSQEVEEIHATVSDVTGLQVRVPPQGGGGGDYHAEDLSAESFLKRPERRYDFVEYRSVGQGTPIRRHDVANFPGHGSFAVGGKVTDGTRARYALTWRPALTTIPQTRFGVFGDETLVFDTMTGEVLARRVFYYRVALRNRGRGAPHEEYTTCGSIDLGTSRKWADRRSRDSYEFVSRVLVPPEITATENVVGNDLAPGSGSRRKLCGRIHIGGGLTRDGVSMRRAGNLLVIEARNSGDRLFCEDFFPRRNAARGAEVVVFADGFSITDTELDELPEGPEMPIPELLGIPRAERW